MESLLSLIVLMSGGTIVLTARHESVLLGGLALHAVALAGLVAICAGNIVAGAVLIGDVTAIAVLALSCYYRLDRKEKLGSLWSYVRSSYGNPMKGLPHWRKEPSVLLQGLSALLAAVVAYGLSDKPISATPEAVSRVASLAGYWLLASGLLVVLLSRDHLKLGGGLLMMINAGQMMYLASARSLETALVAASVAVVVAITLAVSYVGESVARMAVAGEREEVGAKPFQAGVAGEQVGSATEEMR